MPECEMSNVTDLLNYEASGLKFIWSPDYNDIWFLVIPQFCCTFAVIFSLFCPTNVVTVLDYSLNQQTKSISNYLLSLALLFRLTKMLAPRQKLVTLDPKGLSQA